MKLSDISKLNANVEEEAALYKADLIVREPAILERPDFIDAVVTSFKSGYVLALTKAIAFTTEI